MNWRKTEGFTTLFTTFFLLSLKPLPAEGFWGNAPDCLTGVLPLFVFATLINWSRELASWVSQSSFRIF